MFLLQNVLNTLKINLISSAVSVKGSSVLKCAQKDHQDHKKGSIDDRSQEEKNELENLMIGVDEALGKLDEVLQQMQEMREEGQG